MKRKNLTIIIAVVLIGIISLTLFELNQMSKPEVVLPIYFGVDVGFGDLDLLRKVADAVQGYTNLIIIGSTAITNDTVKLTEACNYLYQRGFSFIIYIGFGPEAPVGPDRQFFSTTAKQWGDKLLGVYIFDEPGGKQLDYALSNIDKPVKQADNFTSAAQQYTHVLFNAITAYTGPNYYNTPSLKVYTSDYALYWFDYLVGYNIVFGEFVGNQSRQLSVALCRGAATGWNMNWGTMITWKYDQAPFLENGTELYNDMVLAYENNAQYIIVFNSPDNQTATSDLGILQQEHLDAMKQFYNYIKSHPTPHRQHADNAYVLPRDYGFGFRGPNDTVWGLQWPAADVAISPQIWNTANSLIQQYGTNFDIVYESKLDNYPALLNYNKLIYWNGTIVGGP